VARAWSNKEEEKIVDVVNVHKNGNRPKKIGAGGKTPCYSCLSSFKKRGDFLDFSFFMYDIQHCFICRPSDATVSEDAGIVLLNVL
jgi:hypothetical protein